MAEVVSSSSRGSAAASCYGALNVNFGTTFLVFALLLGDASSSGFASLSLLSVALPCCTLTDGIMVWPSIGRGTWRCVRVCGREYVWALCICVLLNHNLPRSSFIFFNGLVVVVLR